MRHSLIGSGALGSAIARHFARASIPVAVANSRGRESLTEFADHFGAAVIPANIDEALTAHMVILAVPYDALESILANDRSWRGRIVIDATNAINPKTFEPANLRGRPSYALVAELVPGAKVVKGFNHMLARILARDPDDGHHDQSRSLFISGDHEDAKTAATGLMTIFGFEVIDLGELSKGGLMHQYGGPLAPKTLGTSGFHGGRFADIDIDER